MAITLKVTPEILTKTATDIDAELDKIKQQFDAIDEAVRQTRSYWEGNASDTHKQQYEAMQGDIENSVKRLKSQPKKLLQMAGLYSQTESELEAAAQTLSADVIV